METFIFRYAMSIDIDASSEEEAREIFDTMDYDKLITESEFVELEDVYKSR